MKARIKSTGDIMPIAPYAKVTLDVCDDRGTPYEVDFEDIELINEKENADKPDWSSFRREAAKDILAGMMQHRVLSDSSNRFYIPKEKVVSAAIVLADDLIAKLKEK